MFYVYAHYTLDTNKIFYVGKGKLKRHLSKANRNKFWHNIVNKHGFKAVILYDNLNEPESFLREIAIIKSLKRHGFKLANLSTGGEGSSGFKQSEQFKEDRRQAWLGKKPWNTFKHLSPEHKAKCGLKGEKNHMHNKKHTSETLIKMEKNKTYYRGEWHYLYGRGYLTTGSKNANWHGYCVTPFGTFECQKIAADSLSMSVGQVRYRCRSTHKKFAGWYITKEKV